jgi:hypothetical protein
MRRRPAVVGLLAVDGFPKVITKDFFDLDISDGSLQTLPPPPPGLSNRGGGPLRLTMPPYPYSVTL